MFVSLSSHFHESVSKTNRFMFSVSQMHKSLVLAGNGPSGSESLLSLVRASLPLALALRAQFPLSRASRSLLERKRDFSQSIRLHGIEFHKKRFEHNHENGINILFDRN